MKKNLAILITLISLQVVLVTTASAGIVEITCQEAKDYYADFGLIYVWVGKNNQEKRQLIPIYGMMSMENKQTRCAGKKSMRYYYVKSSDKKYCKIAKFCTR